MFTLIKFTLIYFAVLTSVAIGGMFSERSGVINIGLEGIMVFGALGGALTMIYLPATLSPVWIVILTILAAVLCRRIPRRVLNGDYDGAKEYALTMRDIFGEDSFYLELQDHGIAQQTEVNRQLLRLHTETGIPLVCTNDAHYLRREDAQSHDVLLCIQTGKTVDDTNRMRYEPQNFYLRSTEEMEALFAGYPDAVANTQRIADMCRLEFTFGWRP